MGSVRGGGTSLITLLIPPGVDRLVKTGRLLTDEAGAAACIKSRVNRCCFMYFTELFLQP